MGKFGRMKMARDVGSINEYIKKSGDSKHPRWALAT